MSEEFDPPGEAFDEVAADAVDEVVAEVAEDLGPGDATVGETVAEASVETRRAL